MGSFNPRVINANSRSLFPLVMVGGSIFLVVILLFASMAYVPVGSVGVLSIFGRVTAEILPEGTHFVSPFKINNKLSIQTQTQEEHTSTPSMEALNLKRHRNRWP